MENITTKPQTVSPHVTHLGSFSNYMNTSVALHLVRIAINDLMSRVRDLHDVFRPLSGPQLVAHSHWHSRMLLIKAALEHKEADGRSYCSATNTNETTSAKWQFWYDCLD